LRTWAEENKREEVAGDGKKLYKEELHNLHPSRNSIRVIKPMRI
jgi:hypothetical protein